MKKIERLTKLYTLGLITKDELASQIAKEYVWVMNCDSRLELKAELLTINERVAVIYS